MELGTAYTHQPELAAWCLADRAGGKPVYIKELIYAGEFQQSGGARFMVDEPLLMHWASTHDLLTTNGIGVPLPVSHTEDPEANRGQVIGMFVEKNTRGIPALFGRIQFRDQEAAELAKTSQVSLFSPPEFVDGKGNRYVRPIKHVALTDYPVIPALQGFQSIAASFVVPLKKEATMPLKELATRLNIQCEDDAQLAETIVASFEAKSTLILGKDAEIEVLKKKVPADPLTVTAAHKGMLRDNRSMKLGALVAGGHISPAVKADLEAAFCAEEALVLALSRETPTDGFDAIVAALAKNVIVPLGAGNVIVLASDKLEQENPLLEDAKRRHKASKANAN